LDQNYLLGHWYAYIYDQKVIQDDVQHILSTVGEAPRNILEVACGSGRIAIPLARAGHTVTGFDIDAFMLARIPEKAAGLPNLTYYQADALADDWGKGFDVVVLSGNVLVNIITDGDYRQAQELFIRKAAACVKPGGHLYLDFDCVNWEDDQPEQERERVFFERTDDLGTYGRYIGMSGGGYDSRTRVDLGRRRYEITPLGGEPLRIIRDMHKYFPVYEEVISWLTKYGWEIEWHSPVSTETFHAIIWARK